jgi:hypothetical protein
MYPCPSVKILCPDTACAGLRSGKRFENIRPISHALRRCPEKKIKAVI